MLLFSESYMCRLYYTDGDADADAAAFTIVEALCVPRGEKAMPMSLICANLIYLD